MITRNSFAAWALVGIWLGLVGLLSDDDAFAETVSRRLDLKVGNTFIMTSTLRDRVSALGETMHDFSVATRERVEIVARSDTGYHFRVTVLELDVPRLLPSSLAGHRDVKTFTAVVKRHVVGIVYELETDAKGRPVKAIDWREACRQLAEDIIADLSSDDSFGAREIAEVALTETLAMDDKAALKRLAENFIVWAQQHNFNKSVGGTERPLARSRRTAGAGSAEIVSIEGDRVVIAYRENLAASKPEAEADVPGNSRTSRFSPGERGKQQLPAKDFAWEMQRRHELSLDDGMARNVLYRQKASTGQLETERTWTIVVEP